MANYYVIDDNKVVNFIVAESQEIAESITGKTCILQPEESPYPNIGWTYIDGIFTNPEA